MIFYLEQISPESLSKTICVYYYSNYEGFPDLAEGEEVKRWKEKRT